MKQMTDNVMQENYKPDKIEFTVFGSPVPKIEVKSIDLPFSGQHMNITSGARTDYGPLNLKFLLDSGYQNYWTLWNWLNNGEEGWITLRNGKILYIGTTTFQ
jgi:hypothetical protein